MPTRWEKHIPEKHRRGLDDMKPASFYPNGRNPHISPSKEFSENFDRIFGQKASELHSPHEADKEPIDDDLMGHK